MIIPLEADYYSHIMSDSGELTEEQALISHNVNQEFAALLDATISPSEISKFIPRLKRNCSPGYDGVTGEHLIFGMSLSLCTHLANIFSLLLQWHIAPKAFCNCPCVEKAVPKFTLSSTLLKLLEFCFMPDVDISGMQFEFRKGTGTAQACSFLNDVIMYSKHNDSALFMCTLDAEKCFDSLARWPLL